jgi:hypothetical protein
MATMVRGPNLVFAINGTVIHCGIRVSTRSATIRASRQC